MKFVIGFLLSLVATAAAGGSKVNLSISNKSNDYLSIHWVDPRSGDTALIKNDIRPKVEFTITSYQGHKFQVWQEKNPDTGLCGSGKKDDKCDKIGTFEVTEDHDPEYIISEGVQIEMVENELAPRDAAKAEKVQHLLNHINLKDVKDPMQTMSTCKERALKKLSKLDANDDDYAFRAQNIHDELHDCVTVGLAPRIKASNDEVEFERALRLEASNIAENFTCVNTDLESSPDVFTEEWKSDKDGVTRTVHKKLERPASRIHVVAGFASPEECKAIEIEAENDLHQASTADGKGGSKISASRKAMQAGIKPKFLPNGDPKDNNDIAILSSRVYEYANHALGMNLSHHGQEPLMSIQYFGRGRHDIEPDRYTPHCDGRCNGEEHIFGGRMATMVIYCTIPSQGGFTNFQNANVHVRPNSGDAVYFSYINPLTNMTDNGLTQHSGCPVYEGEKKIITQWVRYGVSAETPHNAFNTLGVLRKDDGE